jgi:hypothetical protein
MKWDAMAVIKEASNYKTRSDFWRGNSVAYRKAHKLGMMDSLFPFVRNVEYVPTIATKTVTKKVAVHGASDQAIHEEVAYWVKEIDRGSASLFDASKHVGQEFPADRDRIMRMIQKELSA